MVKPVIDIKRERLLCESRFLALKEVDYADNEQEKTWSYVTRKKTSGVVTVIATKGYKFLFISQKRVPVNKIVLGFPSGLIDEGETPKKAAGRELIEETGYFINKTISISPLLPKSAGLTDESMYIVKCTVKEKHVAPTDPTEGITSFWMTARAFIDYVNGLSKKPVPIVP